MDWYLSLFRNFKVILGIIAGLLFVVVLAGLAAGLSLEDWRNLALILAGLFGLPLAVWRSGVAAKQVEVATKQVELSEAGQNIDRYQKGAAMLGDARLPVRQAGVFGLIELAEINFDTYHTTVMKLLCSFIVDRSQEQELDRERIRDEGELRYPDVDTQSAKYRRSKYIGSDCQTAITGLSKLSEIDREQKYRLSHGGRDLRGANLCRGNLNRCNLRGFDLQNSNLHRASLAHIDMRETLLDGADLSATDLSEAELANARLFRANFQSANLKFANLREAKLSYANLSKATLMDADFFGVDLTEVKGLTVEQLETAKNVDSDFLDHLKKKEKAVAEAVEHLSRP